jgi:hypothetical protein
MDKENPSRCYCGSGQSLSICVASADVLVCHDKWKYDDEASVATLVGFEIHCRSCDAVTHVGWIAQVKDREQALKDARMKLCEVNEC